MTANPLVGAWRLTDYTMQGAPPGEERPLGPDPLGRLVYTADGYMAVQYMPGDRPPLTADNWRRAADEERLAAVRGYGGYSGRYEWLGDRVVHHVEASVYPNWIGTALVRLAAVDGPRLVITAERRPGGPPTPRLVWERLPALPDPARDPRPAPARPSP